MDQDAENHHPVVAVPARNEEERLPRLLAALNMQGWSRAAGRPLPVVVVLNNCTDRSRKALDEAMARLPNLRLHPVEVEFPAERAHVGSARRLAMDQASELCPSAGGVILTTDADARPEAGWVEANLRAVARGADLVGGRLKGDRREEAQLGPGFAARAEAASRYVFLCDHLASLIDPLDHDPWPRHCDHTGGSLAIRAELYRSLGGLPSLPFREDLALVSKARALGARLVHPLDVRVEVSARLVGRAAGGMADCLKEWLRAEAEGRPHLVEDPVRIETRLLRRKAIRDASSALWVEHLAPDEPDAPATVPVAPATARLLAMIERRQRAFRAA